MKTSAVFVFICVTAALVGGCMAPGDVAPEDRERAESSVQAGGDALPLFAPSRAPSRQ